MKKLRWILIAFVSLIIILYITRFIMKKFVYKDTYLDYVIENNTKTGIDPYLILSMIKTESNFNKNAKSSKDAKGLMQILESTKEDVAHLLDYQNLDDIDLYDPAVNIKVGIYYLDILIKRYDGNYYLAICAYNAGIGNVDRWIEDGILSKDLDTIYINSPYKETNNYLRKVILGYKMYKMLY